MLGNQDVLKPEVRIFRYREGGRGKVRLGWIPVCRTEHPVELEDQDHQRAWAAIRVASLSGGTMRFVSFSVTVIKHSNQKQFEE